MHVGRFTMNQTEPMAGGAHEGGSETPPYVFSGGGPALEYF